MAKAKKWCEIPNIVIKGRDEIVSTNTTKMQASVFFSHRVKTVHFCFISAIITLINTDAQFHTSSWHFRPAHKSRYFNTNVPPLVSASSHRAPSFFTKHTKYLPPINKNVLRPKQASIPNGYENKLKKPTASICKREGYFAYPNDCKKFYRCVSVNQIISESFQLLNNYQPFAIFHFVCPAGTIFDETVQVCNHPWATSSSSCTGNGNDFDDNEGTIAGGGGSGGGGGIIHHPESDNEINDMSDTEDTSSNTDR